MRSYLLYAKPFWVSFGYLAVKQPSLFFQCWNRRLTSANFFFYRVFLPTLEEYFSEAIEQADPDAMVEDEYK